MDADHRTFLDATLPYLDVVYQVARQAAGPGQEPEDLVQETYLRAYAGFGSYRGGNVRAKVAPGHDHFAHPRRYGWPPQPADTAAQPRTTG